MSSKSASDWGVKTLKSGLLDSVKTRFAEMESEKHYTVSTYLDPRYKMYYYRDTSTIDDVREIITEEILSQLGGVPIAKSDSVSSVSSQESSFSEGTFEAAMRKIAEKKKPKNQEKNKSSSHEDGSRLYDLCFFRYFRSNKPEGGRTTARTNLTKNEFL